MFSEEARAPRRTVPVAVCTSLAVIGATYALASWAMSVHYGDDQVASVAAQQGPGRLVTMASPAVAEIATVLFMTSLLAAAISFHNAVARYMFALGRERVLPGALGRTRSRTGVPRIVSLTQSAIGLAAIALLAMVWAGLANYATPLGVAPGSGPGGLNRGLRSPYGSRTCSTSACPGRSRPHSASPRSSVSCTRSGCGRPAATATGASAWAPTTTPCGRLPVVAAQQLDLYR